MRWGAVLQSGDVTKQGDATMSDDLGPPKFSSPRISKLTSIEIAGWECLDETGITHWVSLSQSSLYKRRYNKVTASPPQYFF